MTEVITDSIKNRDNIGKRINTLFEESGLSCKIVCAYISESKLFHKTKTIRSLHLICNARSASTNPYILESLIKNKDIQIKSRKDIHAKVYAFKNKVVITSANATPNGLGSGTIEAATLISSNADINKINSWYESLWMHHETENVRDFTKEEWENLKSAWKINISKSSKPNLIDLINTRKIPDDVVFCFWNKVKDAPNKNKVSIEAINQNVLDIPENIDDWDYWLEGYNESQNYINLKKSLKKHYSKTCINIESKDWPITKAYKKRSFASRLLDKPIKYSFRKKELLLTLYRTDKISIPFIVDNDSIELINDSIINNHKEWENYFRTGDGQNGYCGVVKLYKLLGIQN